MHILITTWHCVKFLVLVGKSDFQKFRGRQLSRTLWGGQGGSQVDVHFISDRWECQLPVRAFFRMKKNILFLVKVITFWNLRNTHNYISQANLNWDSQNSTLNSNSSYSFWDGCLKLNSHVLETKTNYDLTEFWSRPQKWKYRFLKLYTFPKSCKIRFSDFLNSIFTFLRPISTIGSTKRFVVVPRKYWWMFLNVSATI